jgi:patatin-like phospholipase/acyl hydrolase
MLPDLLEIRSPPPAGSARATVRVLSIDGGGIRGIIPARVLAEIERCTGSPISAPFDLIADTSSGGLTALALARPGIGGPRYSAADVVALYEAEGAHIFSRSLWHRLSALGNLIEPKYPPGELERVLAEYLGDAPLSAALTTLLIPSYEIERQEPVFFKSHRAVAEAERDFLASPANLRALLGLAEGMLAEQRAALDAVCEQLVAR